MNEKIEIVIPAGVEILSASGDSRRSETDLRVKKAELGDDERYYFLWLSEMYSVPANKVITK